jgi:hypothetical protein
MWVNWGYVPLQPSTTYLRFRVERKSSWLPQAKGVENVSLEVECLELVANYA